MTSRIALALLSIGLLMVVGVTTQATPAQAAVGVNKNLNFQGRLLNAAGAVVADGNYNMRFKIYQDGPGNVAGDTGGTLMWTELWQNSVATGSSAGVTVKNGYFSVNLGSYCAFAGGSCQGNSNTGVNFDQDTLWLSMDVGGTAVSNTPTYDGELLPMRRLASSVYALQAANSDALGGLTSGQYVQLAQGVQTDSSTTNASIYINKTGGTANILDIQRGGADVMLTNNAGQTLFRPTTDSQTALQVQKAGTTTTVFTVDTTNTRVGIGTATPSEALTVNGNFNVRDADTATKQYRFRTSGSNLDLEGSGASLYVSAWSGATFAGTQHYKLVLENSSDNTQAIRTWQFRDSPFGTVRNTIEGTIGNDTTFNQDGEATNFSVQGDTDTSLLYVQGSTDRVGIGTSAPGYKLDVNGTINGTTVQSAGDVRSLGDISGAAGGIGNYSNLLLRSEQFDSGTWVKSSVSAPTANTVTAPDGQATAESLADSASGGSVSQTTSTAPTNANYTFSVWLKSSGTQQVDLRIDGATTGTGTANRVTATTSWQRFSVTQNPNGFTGNLKALIFPGTTAGSGTVSAWGAQLVLGSTPQVYVRSVDTVVAANDGIISNGNLIVQPAVNTTTAFQILTTTNSAVLTVDTSAPRVTANAPLSVTTNPGFNYSDGSMTVGCTGSACWSNNVNGVIGFPGAGTQNGEIAFSPGSGFYLCDSSGSSAGGNYGQCSTRVNLFAQTASLNTSVLTPTLDVPSSGALNIGTSTATNIVVGRSSQAMEILSGLNIDGTYTNSNTRINVAGTVSSNVTTNQYGLQNQIGFAPTGASLGDIYGLLDIPTIGTSAVNITNVHGDFSRVDTTAGYTGTVSNAAAFQAGSPQVSGANPIPSYAGVQVDSNVGNVGVSGKTVTNYGVNITTPGANSSFTTNYGLYIQGTGGATATNYALYNASTASSYFAGALTTAGNLVAQNGLYTGAGAGTLRINASGALSNVTGDTSILTSGTLGVARGGTGVASYTIGDLLYASGATTLSKLADVATGSCLISGGVGAAPSWSSCGSGGAANTALSNLASVAINTSLLPASNNSIDVGSAALGFRSGYFATSALSPLFDTISAGTLNIGTNNATAISLNKPVTVSAAPPDSAGGASLQVTGTSASSTNNQYGLGVTDTVSPGAASTKSYYGIYDFLYSNAANASGALLVGAQLGAEYGGTTQTNTLRGTYSYGKFSGTGTMTGANALEAQIFNGSTGTITTAGGVVVDNPSNSGTITTNYGVYVNNQTAGASDYGVYIQGADTYALYVNAGNSYLGGGLSVNGTASASSSMTTPLLMVGGGDGTASPTAGSIKGASGAGTDIAGANLTIDPGNGTGAGGSGALIFRTATANGGTVAVDVSSSSSVASATSLTWSHTVGSGSNRLLLVGVSYDGTAVSSVTYNGTSMTLVSTATNIATKSSVYQLVNPPSGAHNVVVTLGSTGVIVAGATSFTGVNQSTPLGTAVTTTNSNSNTITSNTVTSATGELVFDAIAENKDQTLTPGSGQTAQWNVLQSSAGQTGAASTKAGATSVTTSWSGMGTGWDTALVDVPIHAAAGSGTGSNTLTERMRVATNGNVCIGVSSCTNTLGVSGTIAASGTITASSTPDIAETIAASEDVTAADVVMADPKNTERVVRAQGAYNGAAVGVISDGTSSFMINAHGGTQADLTGKPMVLAGRVPVKVTNAGGAIAPGDYLTTSDVPGYAMKATHAGPTIGKALGFFDENAGTVLALINISYADPAGETLSLQNSTQALQQKVDNLTAQLTSGTFDSINVAGTATMKSLVVTDGIMTNDLAVTGVAEIAELHVSGNVTVAGVLSVNGHIVTGGTVPTVAAGTAACANPAVTISGTDTAGTITIVTGNTACATPGVLAAVTFAKAFEAEPRVVLTPTGTDAPRLQYGVGTTTGGGFELTSQTPVQAGKTYTYNYLAIQ